MNGALRFRVLLGIAMLGLGAAIWLIAANLGGRKVPPPDDTAKQQVDRPLPADSADGALQAEEAWQALQRGVEYLIGQQDADGGWHSDAYGQLRGGAAVSALVLCALSHTPEDSRDQHQESLRRGMDFLRAGVQPGGYVANADGSSDYPTYATAMMLVAADRLRVPLDEELRQRLIIYVASSQLTEEEGWRPKDEHYGGWDMVGPAATAGQRITTGTNLSVTSFALEALAGAEGAEAEAARKRASLWLPRCQSLGADGGFVFTPVLDDAANKAGREEKEAGSGEGRQGTVARSAGVAQHPRSYGTMTADGLRSLLYAGYAADSTEVRAAVDWLQQNSGLEAVPGFEHLPPEVEWQRSLRFYYYASLAKAGALLPDLLNDSRSAELAQILMDLQLEDGRWENESSRMREDDPLIATALAVIALAEIWVRDGTSQTADERR